jgi:polyisoprenoid-binding protein YceI
MTKWILEPGHTAAEFCARHMMVTWVRGHFKNIQGILFFDPANPGAASVEVTIDANGMWSGEPDRDTHLRSADFLDAETHPQIVFKGNEVELIGETDATLIGELTIRGVTRRVSLSVRYLGQWQLPGGKAASTEVQRLEPVLWRRRQSIGSISALVGTRLWKNTE